MVVVAVVSAVVALVLLMVLLQSRGALASTNEALASSEGKADAAARRADEAERNADQQRQEIASLEQEIARLEDEIAEATRLAGEQADVVEAERSRVADLQAELDNAVSARHQLEVELAERAGEISAAEAQANAAEAVAEAQEQVNLTLTHENESLQEQLVVAADEAAKRSTPSVPSVLVSNDGEDLDVPGFSPGMAWDLELVRSERTWRYSVAANPVIDPNPFEHTENPLRLAIEIEALALREDVGAFIGIDWRAGTDIDPVTDPARAHLTLRLAQELLASAARELSPSTLIVTSDASRGGVSLEVVASDPDDVDFKIPPPPIASEWIGIDEHGGMVVTVRVD